MCAIAGFCDFTKDLRDEYEANDETVSRMGREISHRGPDDFNTLVDADIAFAHARLAIIDVENGVQPMTKFCTPNGFIPLDKNFYKKKCPLRPGGSGFKEDCPRVSIVYNGEIYNAGELREKMILDGMEFETDSDTEVILNGYLRYGVDISGMLNGIFAFAIWDGKKKRLILSRDRFGVKPLFFMKVNDQYLFASEIKAILKHPKVKAVVDREGLCDLFATGPAKTPKSAVFKDIHQLEPGKTMIIMKQGVNIHHYFRLTARTHEDDYETTVKKTRELLVDSISRQTVSDVGLCTLMSGGIDSSLVSSVVSRKLKEEGKILDTYSFDYVDNDKYFKSSAFTPEKDRPFVDIMKNAIGSRHTYLYCDSRQLYNALFEAVEARDLPGMADVDSSMLVFCRQIKPHHSVCLSGECADEVFGGYPWFRDKEALETECFPWSKDIAYRESALRPEIADVINIREYASKVYEKTRDEVPFLEGEPESVKLYRRMNYMNIVWFMQTLLERKDRMTMKSGLEVRVPFADHRLVEYVYNVPWEFKYRNGVVKGLLRDAAGGLLPKEVLERKKSPYPKTFNPEYTAMVKKEILRIKDDPCEPLNSLVSRAFIEELTGSEDNLTRPWFGQLMAGPQLMAYLISINYWLKRYNVEIVL